MSEAAKLSWYETSSAFYIAHPDGRVHCMGDGVDMFFDEAGEPLEGEEFYLALDKMMDDPETMEAYFG